MFARFEHLQELDIGPLGKIGVDFETGRIGGEFRRDVTQGNDTMRMRCAAQ